MAEEFKDEDQAVKAAESSGHMLWRLSDAGRRRDIGELKDLEDAVKPHKGMNVQTCPHCSKHGWVTGQDIPSNGSQHVGCVMKHAAAMICMKLNQDKFKQKFKLRYNNLLALSELFQLINMSHKEYVTTLKCEIDHQSYNLVDLILQCHQETSNMSTIQNPREIIAIQACTSYCLSRFLENPQVRCSVGIDAIRFAGTSTAKSAIAAKFSQKEVVEKAKEAAMAAGGTVEEASIVAGIAAKMAINDKDEKSGGVANEIKNNKILENQRRVAQQNQSLVAKEAEKDWQAGRFAYVAALACKEARGSIESQAAVAAYVAHLAKATPDEAAKAAIDALNKVSPNDGHGIDSKIKDTLREEAKRACEKKARIDKLYKQQISILSIILKQIYEYDRYAGSANEIAMLQLNSLRILDRLLTTDMLHPKVIDQTHPLACVEERVKLCSTIMSYMRRVYRRKNIVVFKLLRSSSLVIASIT